MNPRSILVIKPSSLGDVVHTLPAVSAIHEAEPQAKITWVINPEWAPLLRGNPTVSHVRIFPRKELGGFRVFPWLKRTAALQPDVALDFQGLFRSGMIARASGAAERWGLSDSREGSRLFYNHVAQVDRHAHAVERYLELARAFGATVTRPLRFPLPTGDPLPRFDPYPPFVLLHPFSRGRGKSMGARAVETFCVAMQPTRVVIAGLAQAKLSVPDNTIDLTNHTTLLQLIWLIRAARWTVSVDSGPMHIAAAISPRLVSVHTWSDPRRVGPFNPEAWIWKSGELLRAAELNSLPAKPKARLFTSDDVASVIELVRKNWDDSAKE